jgi:phosphoribosyl 1,2-cyclic phosphodiesterase
VRIYVLGSGSSGNCAIVEAEGERLLIDAGMGPVRATERMRALGADLIGPRSPLGLFVTHDHGDHSSHARPLARCLRAPVFAHDRAVLQGARRKVDVRSYVPGQPVALGPFVVEALPVPHDAPQVALRVSAGGYRFAIATDLGHAPPGFAAWLGACDLVLLEANYCAALLDAGPYPLHLKRRVAGPLGHLGNEQAARIAATLEGTRVSRLVLGHLSRTNNSPERALGAVAPALRRLFVEALPHGEPRRFDVDVPPPGAPAPRPEQLALGFGGGLAPAPPSG